MSIPGYMIRARSESGSESDALLSPDTWRPAKYDISLRERYASKHPEPSPESSEVSSSGTRGDGVNRPSRAGAGSGPSEVESSESSEVESSGPNAVEYWSDGSELDAVVQVAGQRPDVKTCDCVFNESDSYGPSLPIGFYNQTAASLSLLLGPGFHDQTANCEAYQAACEYLKVEEANLLARPEPTTLAEYPAAFQPLIKARFSTAKALIGFGTRPAFKEALRHFNTLLCAFRVDDLKVRDYIPHLLLKIDEDQACYDFIKWWVTVNDKDHYNGGYDWNDATLPFLDIHDADPFEPVDELCASGPSLSQLVALTLLKLRLYLDIAVVDDSWNYSRFKGSLGPLGHFRGIGTIASIAKAKVDFPDEHPRAEDASAKDTVEEKEKQYPTTYVLHDQYTKLIRAVHAANPYFWETLINRLTKWTSSADDEPQSPSVASLPGTKEEACFVVSQALRAWKREDGVCDTLNLSTCDLGSVYQPPYSTHRKAEATGQVFPSHFQPDTPTSDPRDVFHLPFIGDPLTNRFFKNGMAKTGELLVYAAGACANSGQPDARGGWAVVYKEPAVFIKELANGIVSGRLEKRGPDGGITDATSSRAELRAAVAALRISNWQTYQQIKRLVIATHSSYVVDIATCWVEKWMPNGWKTGTGDDVPNEDLWDLLLREVDRLNKRGLRVEFWRIDEKLNQMAITAAREATGDEVADVEEFTDIDCDRFTTHEATHRPLYHPRAVVICVEERTHRSLREALYGHINQLDVRPGHSPTKALALLNQNPPPSIIIITDGAIAADGRRKLFKRMADRLHQGATVVIMGRFAKKECDFNRFFARLGVPWRYSRKGHEAKGAETHHKRVVLHPGYDNHLTYWYNSHCVYLKNVARSDI